MFLKKLKAVIYFIYWCWLFQWIFLGTDLRNALGLSHDAYVNTGWGSTSNIYIGDKIWFKASSLLMFNLGIIIDFLIIFAL
jgi:hypothetical protein